MDYMVPAGPGGSRAEELRAWCGERLAPFKIPTECRFLAALPKTTTQKVQKDALRAACVSEREGGPGAAH